VRLFKDRSTSFRFPSFAIAAGIVPAKLFWDRILHH
jgi:hypothetical protein